MIRFNTISQDLTLCLLDDFLRKGIPKAEIPKVIMTALERNKVVGQQGERPVYEVDYNRAKYNIAITVSDNGFVVGANPRSL